MPTYSAGKASIDIGPSLKGFRAQLEADLKKIDAQLGVAVHPNLAQARADLERWRLQEERRAIDIPVNVETRSVQRARRDLDSLASAGTKAMSALKWNAGALGISTLPMLATGLAEVAGALTQVAGAAWLVPGAVAGAVASIGTLAIGVSGVKDAYTAVTAAATTSASKQTSSANSAARAQRDLARAYRDARREVEDLNISLRGDQISEQQAILNAQRVRRDLGRDFADGQIQDQLDLQSRLLDIQAADQAAVEAHVRAMRKAQDVGDANAKGIEGADQVVAAHEAVAAAAGTAGAASDKAAEEMAKHAPEVQAFVQTLVDLKPQFADLKKTIEANIFAGLSGELRTLVDQDLPGLQTGLGAIGTAWNTNIVALMRSLGSDSSKGLLDRILGNTADAQTRFTKAIDPLVHGIGTLAAAGTDVLPRLADGFGKAMTRFDTFITAADQDGRLDKWINDGIDALDHLGNVGISAAEIFGDINQALGGDGLLAKLDSGAKKLHEFLSSDKGQAELKEFFHDAKEQLAQWKPTLEALPGLMTGVMDAAKAWADVILPPLGAISGFLGDHPGLIKAVAEAFLAWKTIDFASNILNGLGSISTTLGEPGGKDGKGGRGLLRKLGMAAAFLGAMEAVKLGANWLNPDDGQEPSAAEAVGGGLANIGGMAVAGAQVGGVPGAIVGAGLGVGASVVERAAGDLARQKAEAEKNRLDREKRNPYQAPPVNENRYGPALDIRALVLAGQAPGYSMADDGVTIIGPDGKPAMTIGPDGTPVPIYGAQPPPGFRKGGPTPSTPGPGPTGGYIAEIHKKEWVSNERGRAVLGDEFLAAADRGVVDISRLPKFDVGGPGDALFDNYGNPITRGNLPGPAAAPNAPNPMQGGLGNVLGSFASGLGGSIGNIAGMFGGPAGVGGGAAGAAGAGMSLADRAAGIPGLIGLAGAAGSSNPALAMGQWGQNTAKWLGDFTAKTVGGFGTALWQGALDMFGLGDSMLSLKNPWTQAAMGIAQFGLANDGPISKLMGTPGGGTAIPGLGAGFGSKSITLGDGSTISIPTLGTADGSNLSSAGGGASMPAAAAGGSGKQGASWSNFDAIAKSFGLTVTSGFRDPNGPTIAGVPASKSYHGSGRAHDYGGSPAQMRAFADFMAANYGSQIKELIFDQKGFGSTIHDGQVVGPFGSFYTMGQAGYHGDHVHIAFANGGAARGPGGPKGDKIAAFLSDNEHVFTSEDVNAMGGQDEVYAFRRALHRAWGGSIGRALLNITPAQDQAQTKQLAAKAPSPGPAPANALKPLAPQPPPTAATAPQPNPAAPPGSPGADPNAAGSDAQQRAGQLAAPQVGAAPRTLNHNLTAISTGISSAASTIGSLAQSAIGAAPFPGAGEAGALVAGLVKQGGKIADNAVNVFSSSLVGNLGDNTTAGAYGAPVLSQAPQPVRPIDNRTMFGTVTVGDPREFVREQQLYEAQRSQSVVDSWSF
nr:hypothetical protein [Mycobacterium sp. UM_NZ2]